MSRPSANVTLPLLAVLTVLALVVTGGWVGARRLGLWNTPDAAQRQSTPFGSDATAAAQATFPTPGSTNVVLGRPTDTSIVLNVLAATDATALVACGTSPTALKTQTEAVALAAGQPQEITLNGLIPNTRYYYSLSEAAGGVPVVEGTFQTQRAPGSTFTFEVMGDSHPERRNQFDASLYSQMLTSAAADRPDFFLTSGDDFSVDTLQRVDASSVASRYSLQRPHLSIIGQVAPIFLVNGNHEQAAGYNLDGTPNNVAVWAQNARNAMFSQPAPDSFYTGDTEEVPYIGQLRDYYAWTWGDALFVVIDPYWHSTVPVDNVLGGGKKTGDKWGLTIGDEQYAWLQKTLESSTAKYKFVFAHHVLGTGRGGIEQAALFEWGGQSRPGVDEFATRRPGWDLPIHQLMAQNGVTVFFQGHDHLFARQVLDGVTYQELPNPADPNYAADQEKAYRSGDVLPSSGRARVTVSPEKVTVEYVRSYLPKDATGAHPDGEVAYSYELAAGK